MAAKIGDYEIEKLGKPGKENLFGRISFVAWSEKLTEKSHR
jgi:hypothetical protein